MLENLTKEKKLERAQRMFRDAMDRDYAWQREAREDFLFRDGFQWSADERQILQDELRPVLTFNLTKSAVDVIMGMNEDVKVRHRATPVEQTDGFLAEVINDLVDWVNDSADFEREEDGALESAAICGRGYTAIDFIPDPNRFGEIKMTELDVPVHEVHFDPAARRPQLEDASYITWDKWLSVEDFKLRYPKVSNKKVEELRGASGNPSDSYFDVSNGYDYSVPRDDYRNADYDRELDLHWYDRSKNMIRVVHMEYWEAYKRYYAFNPESGKFEEIPKMPTKEQKEQFKSTFGEDLTVETVGDKRVRWLQFNGDTILYDNVSPLPHSGFSIVPVFAYRDASKRTSNHFGVVRLIKDPQKEVNKRWSQTLNMLNQQVQPGIYAETDAFVDERQAEQSLKEAGAITWINSGALAGGKIKERSVPAFPNAPMQMEKFSEDIMKKITGINPDLMGQDRGRQEPGVVVKMRQQQGITLLKPLFRNFNAMKKSLFQRQVAIILRYMPDDQIMRVLGQNDRYTIDENGVITDNVSGQTAELRNLRELEYNINSEPNVGSISKRMLELQAMLEMSERVPVPPEQIVEKLDISSTEKQRWLEYIQQMEQSQAEQQQQAMEAEFSMKDRELSNDERETTLDFITDMAKIKQMAEKDEKNMATNFARMDREEQNNILQFTVQMAQAMQAATAQTQKGEENARTGKASDKGANAKT